MIKVNLYVLIPTVMLFTVISCFVCYCNGKSVGSYERYLQIEKYQRDHPSDAHYWWNENGDIQYVWTYGPTIHVESVEGGTTIFGKPFIKEATAAELELYIKKQKEKNDKQKRSL